jgi:hypothetical protein
VSTVGKLLAVDGVSGVAIMSAAHAKLKLSMGNRPQRGGISRWDASGLFQDLLVAPEPAGAPSPRTLLLLYASDLAFRLRWEIQPALADGRLVVAAPYVQTAIAFGRAAGLPGGWLVDLFRFVPPASDYRYVASTPGRSATASDGFVEFGCAQLAGRVLGLTRAELVARTRAHLSAAEKRAKHRRQRSRLASIALPRSRMHYDRAQTR